MAAIPSPHLRVRAQRLPVDPAPRLHAFVRENVIPDEIERDCPDFSGKIAKRIFIDLAERKEARDYLQIVEAEADLIRLAAPLWELFEKYEEEEKDDIAKRIYDRIHPLDQRLEALRKRKREIEQFADDVLRNHTPLPYNIEGDIEYKKLAEPLLLAFSTDYQEE